MTTGTSAAPAREATGEVPREPSRAPSPPSTEQSRARYPDETGFIERDGVRVFWERYGDGAPTILLMPTWSIVHSRHWKGQIAYLARHFRVVTYDGRGNGRSDRLRTFDLEQRQVVADALRRSLALGAHLDQDVRLLNERSPRIACR